MKKIQVFILLVCLNSSLMAIPKWYNGKITRIWHYNNDGFIIKFDSGSVKDCKHEYIYFKESLLGKTQKDSVYSMGLSAFHSNSKVGVVIDKTGTNQYCHGLSMDLNKILT
jgi:hypothetical protein